MKKHYILKLTPKLLLLGIVFTFSSCSDDGGEGSKFTYKVDGESQKVQTVSGILQFETQYDHEGRGLYITAAEGLSKILSIGVSNWDFQNPPDEGILTGDYDATFDFESTEENPFANNCLELAGEGVTLCDGGLVTWISGGSTYYSTFDGETDATITITKCDPIQYQVNFMRLLQTLMDWNNIPLQEVFQM
jgi:hypothetical protein